MRPSVADVAKLAGVSTATVSRVLNGSASLRPSTRNRVQQAIQTLGYQLPVSNSAEKDKLTKTVMILVPDIENPFYSGVVHGIENTAKEQNFSVMLTNTQGTNDSMQRYLQQLQQHQICGVISLDPMTAQSTLPQDIALLPWIACSEYVPHSPMAYVSIDHHQAAKDAVLYLISQGHKKIAFVTSDESYLYAQRRRAGYEDALRSAGIAIRPDYIQAVGGLDYPLGELGAHRLLTLNEPPTAIFAVSDTLAIGVMKAIFRAKLRIPEDIAVIGFDDIPIANMFEPSLTTIAQPSFEIGQKAMKMLIHRINGENVQIKTISHTLVIRDTA
ncbi:LacI family DNA-binding transcriptional regulator [Celerinatantimonas sp. YJH-8]|uniref:LacI family DNA-binding transcriptional regulator n=1 Tax=Celerinatantimonas sp. YJH-8 TaxID=3228714 RepID=UPI0038CAB942